MGILNGNVILNSLQKIGGVYSRYPSYYKIYVDGEFFRHKGMIKSVLSQLNPEQGIAKVSYNYLLYVIDSLKSHMSESRVCEIYVFMDGKKRVINKTTHRPVSSYDSTIIRSSFIDYCRDAHMKVIELEEGESELQMYVRRDKQCPLNVFITNDSDMAAIMYGHMPLMLSSKYLNTTDQTKNESCSSKPHVQQIDGQTCSGVTEKMENESKEIIKKTIANLLSEKTNNDVDIADAEERRVDTNENSNRFDDSDNDDNNSDNDSILVDSCMWFYNRSFSYLTLGMDFIEELFGFSKLTFRQLVALVGTDFTEGLITKSMLEIIVSLDKECIAYINSLNSIHEKIAAFLYVSIKNGGTLKVLKYNQDIYVFNPRDLEDSINIYVNYVNSGIMSNEIITIQNMSFVTRIYLSAMINCHPFYMPNKKELIKKFNNITLQHVIENKFRQRFDPNVIYTIEQIDNMRYSAVKLSRLNENYDNFKTKKQKISLSTDSLYNINDNKLKDFNVERNICQSSSSNITSAVLDYTKSSLDKVDACSSKNIFSNDKNEFNEVHESQISLNTNFVTSKMYGTSVSVKEFLK